MGIRSVCFTLIGATCAIQTRVIQQQRLEKKDDQNPVQLDSMWVPGGLTQRHYKAPNTGETETEYAQALNEKEPSSTVPPVSKAMIAILSMAAQYFVLYSCMAILRTAQTLGGVSSTSQIAPTMIAATATVNFVPMVSIAILATRIRAVFLTTTPQNGGRPDDFDLPPPYAKTAFFMCCFSILAQLLLILLYPVLTGKAIDPNYDIDSDGNLLREPEQQGLVGLALKVLRNVAFVALYAGQTMICYCLLTMEAPDSIIKANAWSEQPALPSSIHAVIQLVILYFLIYLVIAVVREYFSSKRVLIGVMNLCAWSVTMAPMLAILFIGARLRELQIRGSGTAPDYKMAEWAGPCFHLCWISLYVQCALIIAVVFLKGDVEQGDFYGDVRFIMTNLPVFMWFHAIRWIAQLALYGGLVGVLMGIFSMEHPLGPEYTPKVSPAMECSLNLTGQFFFVYVGIFVVATLRQFANSSFTLAMQTFAAAQAVVMFCPMLCVLFFGARARALEITEQKGAPQGWVQQCMEAATTATMIQLILCLFLPIVLQKQVESDPDGNIKADKGSFGKWGFIVLETLRYICMVGMYGGALGVVFGMFLMTPENCTGEGGIPILGNVIPRVTSPLTSGIGVPVASLPIGVPAAASPAPAASFF